MSARPLRRLTRWERLRFNLRQKWPNRIAWLWRRLPGCKCDPDGYSLRDMPQPICDEAVMEQSEMWKLLFPHDTIALTCLICGHEEACHAADRLKSVNAMLAKMGAK